MRIRFLLVLKRFMGIITGSIVLYLRCFCCAGPLPLVSSKVCPELSLLTVGTGNI